VSGTTSTLGNLAGLSTFKSLKSFKVRRPSNLFGIHFFGGAAEVQSNVTSAVSDIEAEKRHLSHLLVWLNNQTNCNAQHALNDPQSAQLLRAALADLEQCQLKAHTWHALSTAFVHSSH
jgi:hypothetical protein